jgi:hypothetical protein
MKTIAVMAELASGVEEGGSRSDSFCSASLSGAPAISTARLQIARPSTTGQPDFRRETTSENSQVN